MTESKRWPDKVDDLELLEYLLADEGVEISQAATIQAREDASETPLSYAQRRMWVLHQMDPQSPAYNILSAVRLSGALDVTALQASLNEIVRRHETLRTCFQTVEGLPSLRVLTALTLDLPVLDLRALAVEEQRRFVQKQTAEESIKPFDLERGPLVRARLLRLSDEEHVALLSMHHIVSDAWSMGVLIRELGELYGAFRAGQPSPLRELALQYGDFSAWQHKQLQGELLEEPLAYWKHQLAGLTVLELFTDRARPSIQTFAGASRSFAVSAQSGRALKALAQEENCTLFMTLLAAFQVLLHRYTQQEDIVVGTPIANRNRRETEPLIGFFVNTLVLRTDMSGQPTFRSLLRRVRDVALAAYAHQDLPFEQLVRELLPERDLSHNPLFQVMFTLQNAPAEPLDLPGLILSPVETETIVAKFDLTLVLEETEAGLAGAFEYNTDLFDPGTIAGMVDHFKNLLEGIVADPDRSIAVLPLLTEVERHRILLEWNDTATPYPRHASIPELFESQAEKTPDAIAVVYGAKELTYSELNRRANLLAHFLRRHGVGSERPVGLFLNRSADMIVGMLGVLKAGGAYVPLDPAYPSARLEFMLEDTRAGVVLTQQELLQSCPAHHVRCVCLDRDWEEIQEQSAENPANAVGADTLAYIMFTSGSTGTPKGVSVLHRGVVRLVKETHYARFSRAEVFLQLAPTSFDASTLEIWGPLLNGGRLVVMPPGEISLEELGRVIAGYGITTLWLTAGLFHQMVEFNLEGLRPLRQLLAGGDVLSISHVKRMVAALPGCELINGYGPTENTTFTCCHPLGNGEELGGSVPIGRPISNTRVYVLDSGLEPVPVGVPGEIYIGGDGLAREYLNCPDLTAERFVPDPFSSEPGARLYRTGDRGRFLADGLIDFIGRLDAQVKVRGFRIEPAEIEKVLEKLPGVREAVVVARDNSTGNRSLVAYVVPRPGHKMNRRELRAYLGEKLPDYMIPAQFVALENLPLTVNGKVDKEALPAREASVEPTGIYQAPRNPLEHEIARIWQDVLGRDRVGIHDNYFELGGDSIGAIQVVSRLNRAGWDLKVREVFRSPTIAALAPQLQASKRTAKQEVVSGRVPLTAIQRWFFEEHTGDLRHFNQAVLLRARQQIDEESLRPVFQKIQEHHDGLRLTYRTAGGAVQQVNSGLDHPLSFDVVDLRSEQEPIACLESHADEVQRSFDLENGPLMKVVLYRLETEDRILIVIHHLVVDGVSWRILLEDLHKGYRQRLEGKEIDFGPKTDSFKHWAEAVESYSTSERLRQELKYWSALLAAETTPLLNEGEEGENLYADCRSVRKSLSRDQTENLLSGIHHAYHTEMNDILLTALGRALGRWGPVERTLVTMEGHGREPVDNELDVGRTIGWFTSLYPFLLKTPGEDIGRQIKHVKEALRNVPDKGVGFEILRRVTPTDMKGLDLAVRPRLSLNYLGRFDEGDDNSLFEFADEYSGQSIGPRFRRHHDLDVVAMVVRGRFELSIVFNPRQYRPETVEKLLDHFEQELLAIIEHCRSRKEDEKTPADFATRTFSLEEYQAFLQAHSWKASQIEDVYPLSPLQEGLLFQALYESDSQAYFVQMSFNLEGKLQLEPFTRSWNEVCRRHAVLRTAFVQRDLAQPLQIVLKERNPEFVYLDLQGLTATEQLARIEDYQKRDRERGFDLEHDTLIRIALVQLTEYKYLAIWSYHHVILDGWCLSRIFKDFIQSYQAQINRAAPQLPAVPPYSDYIRWLQEWDRKDARDYWSRYLSGYQQLATLPRFTRPGKSPGYVLKEKTIVLEGPVSAGLKELARYGVTLNTVLQCIWGLILSRYNRVDDVIFGAVVSGRPSELPGVEDMVGLFINAIPVRVRLEPNLPFSEMLRAIQHASLETEPYHYLSLAEIQQQSPLGRETFDHLLIFENYPAGRELFEDGGPGLEFTIDPVGGHDRTHYNLDLTVVPGDTIWIKFTYNGNIYLDDQIERTAEHFQTAIRNILQDPDQPVRNIQIIPDRERRRVLNEFNETRMDCPPHETILDLFEEQVEKHPGQTAVIYEGARLTYQQLNERANRLAHHLRALSIGPEQVVGLCVERSLEMVVGVLGILKSGGAYLPLDPQYPKERLAFMMEDARAPVMLTQERLLDTLPENGARIFCLDSDWEEISRNSEADPASGVMAENLAYVIYTSGSTGRPKGVMIEHGSLVNAAYAYRHAYGLEAFDVRLLQMASLSFDVFAGDLVRSLTNGGQMIVCPSDALLDPALLYALIAEYRISYVESTPGIIVPLMDYIHENNLNVGSVKMLVFGADTLQPEHYRTLVERFGAAMRIVNGYGVTEATIDSSYFEQKHPALALEGSTPIGKPFGNVQCYVLDRECRELPIGVPGELHIGGSGLARGYWNHPALTAQRFVPHPVNGAARLYKTGDIARWLPDGDIEFLGRMDDQVKIRGYRIELGEIEDRLLQHKEVTEAVVLTRGLKDSSKDLVAYVVPAHAESQDSGSLSQELRQFLSEQLPTYMIPSYFIKLEMLPLTPNGKVDRTALPDPGEADIDRRSGYTAPRSRLEEQLAGIWQEVLQVDQIGIHDNFFELGGHSLKAMQIVSRIHKTLEVKLGLREFFNQPTIAALRSLVHTADAAVASAIEPAPRQDYYDLSHAQQRLWLLHHMEGATAYNMPEAYLFEGELDTAALQKAFATLIERHEVLRTAFVEVEGEPKQKIYPGVEFTVREIDLSAVLAPEEDARRIADREASTPFDLTRPPLIRATVVRLGENRHVFILVIHHIIGDGWSGIVLYEEIRALYDAYHRGMPSPLAPLRIQYKDFAAWQNKKGFEQAERYWLAKLAGMPEEVRLPYDLQPGAHRDFRGNFESRVFESAIMGRLRALAVQKNTTLSNVILAIFDLFLFQLTKQQDLCVGISLANRNHPDLENLVGFFVNILPIRTHLSEAMEFDELMEQIIRNSYEALDHQDYPFDLLIQKLNPGRYGNRQPMLNVIYAFQNFADVHVDIRRKDNARSGLSTLDTPRSFDLSFKTSKFDLTLFVFDDGDQVHLTMEYDTGLFLAATIRDYLATLERFARIVAGQTKGAEKTA